MPRALVALGSNEGDRQAAIDAAVEAICGLERTCVEARSRSHETRPVGGPPQPAFLNAAALVVTQLRPRALLSGLLEIERARGRVRREPNGPRPIDLDVILYDDVVLAEPGLEVPHPRFRERGFVLLPAVEIAPGMRDPVTGLTLAELYERWRKKTGAPEGAIDELAPAPLSR